MIGDRLGKWVIYKELGRGGMGRVYLAQEEIGGRQAALKVLAAELAQDTGFLHRFQREIETLSTLDHPGIVRFYESGFENGLYFYAMEYVEGHSLEELLLRQKRLPWQDVLDIALQICPALKHVHDHGVIHRDIKPPNILRTAAGEVKLTDFGIAKVFASTHLTATGGVVGTAEFLSPEQAAGKPVSKRSDLYSLGVVLYMLLTGRAPFEGSNFLDLLHKHRYAQFDRPQKIVPELPYELDEIVCQLLEKDPAARPADCLVLGRHLESVRRKLDRKGRGTEVGRLDATAAENKPGPEVGGPGPATLMSRLMREELRREKQGSPLGRAFNNVWVLLPLALLCLGVMVWSFWPASPETLYERGAELMQSNSLADKERAWQDYLGPLETDHPDHPYKKEVAELRRQLEAARKDDEPVPVPSIGEAQRFYLRGQRLYQEGKVAEARRLWEGLATVFKGVESEKEWVRRAEKGLAELDNPAVARERWVPARAALKRAAELRDRGKLAEAEQIWSALESLYAPEEATAQEILREIRAARQKKKG